MDDRRTGPAPQRYSVAFGSGGLVVGYVSYTLVRQGLGHAIGISNYPETWTWWVPALAPGCAAAAVVAGCWRCPSRGAARTRSFAIGYGVLALAIAAFSYAYYS